MYVISFQNKFSSIILNRGYELYLDCRVSGIKRNKNNYRATVLGTKRYDTFVIINDGIFVSGGCSCPCNNSCKHMAALLYALDNNEYYDEDIENINNDNNDFYQAYEKEPGIIKEIDKLIKSFDKLPSSTRENKISNLLNSIEMPFNEDSSGIINILDYFLNEINNIDGKSKLKNYIVDILNRALFIALTYDDEKLFSYVLEHRNSLSALDMKYLDSNIEYLITMKLCKLLYKELPNMKLYSDLTIVKTVVDILGLDANKLLILYNGYEINDYLLNYIIELIPDGDLKRLNLAIHFFYNNMKHRSISSYTIYKRYRSLNDNSNAIKYIRNTILERKNVELYYESLEISSKEIEEEFYLKRFPAMLFIVYNLADDKANMMRIVKRLDDISHYSGYYYLFSKDYREDYISFYYNYLINNIKAMKASYEIKNTVRYVKELIDLSPGYERLHSLAVVVFSNGVSVKLKNQLAYLKDYLIDR